MLSRPVGRSTCSAASARSQISRPHLVPILTHGRRSRPVAVKVVADGGGGSSGGSKGSGGGGGGGGGGGDSSENNSNGSKPKTGLLKGWEERVAYDPEFPIKVLLEQIIGVGASVIGDMSSRPNWGLNELDFVFSTLVVGSVLNFSIMYLLAPTGAAAAATASAGLLQTLLSEKYLRAWGAPGGNMFEPGSFSAGRRLINFGYKGVTFAIIGTLAGILGTSLSNGLLLLRKNLDPNFKTNEPPNILYNACTWGLHMGLSANLRYQILGGTDRVLVKVMPIPAFRVYQAGIRAANNILGGISFVTLARLLGVQKTADTATA